MSVADSYYFKENETYFLKTLSTKRINPSSYFCFIRQRVPISVCTFKVEQKTYFFI